MAEKDLWKMSTGELRAFIEQSAGYKSGTFMKYRTLSEHPCMTELVNCARACLRYERKLSAVA